MKNKTLTSVCVCLSSINSHKKKYEQNVYFEKNWEWIFNGNLSIDNKFTRPLYIPIFLSFHAIYEIGHLCWYVRLQLCSGITNTVCANGNRNALRKAKTILESLTTISMGDLVKFVRLVIHRPYKQCLACWYVSKSILLVISVNW